MIGSSSRASSWLNWAQQPREAGGLGLAPHQAAGVVGNLVKESGDDLPAWGPTGDNRTAWGTAQWRNERLDRLKQMYPDNYQTVEAQQAFMRHELDTTHNKAYQALQAAQTPEEAATAFNRLYEVSADNTGGREKAARQFMAQFGGGTSSAEPGALTSAFAPTESKSSSMPTPALSADETLGPGALALAPPQDKMAVIGQALSGMGSSLAGISNPDQAKAITAQALAMQKQGVDQGTWSHIQTFPNGTAMYVNSKDPRKSIAIPGNFAKPEKPEVDEYEKAAKIAGAKSYQDYGDSVASAASNANGMAGDVAELKRVYANPARLSGHKAVSGCRQHASSTPASLVTRTAPKTSQTATSPAHSATSSRCKLVQDDGHGKLLPGSFSDSDRKFVTQMSTSLENNPDANQRLLDDLRPQHPSRTAGRSGPTGAPRQQRRHLSPLHPG
jgi:hypothetical protein